MSTVSPACRTRRLKGVRVRVKIKLVTKPQNESLSSIFSDVISILNLSIWFGVIWIQWAKKTFDSDDFVCRFLGGGGAVEGRFHLLQQFNTLFLFFVMFEERCILFSSRMISVTNYTNSKGEQNHFVEFTQTDQSNRWYDLWFILLSD